MPYNKNFTEKLGICRKLFSATLQYNSDNSDLDYEYSYGYTRAWKTAYDFEFEETEPTKSDLKYINTVIIRLLKETQPDYPIMYNKSKDELLKNLKTVPAEWENTYNRLINLMIEN